MISGQKNKQGDYGFHNQVQQAARSDIKPFGKHGGASDGRGGLRADKAFDAEHQSRHGIQEPYVPRRFGRDNQNPHGRRDLPL